MYDCMWTISIVIRVSMMLGCNLLQPFTTGTIYVFVVSLAIFICVHLYFDIIKHCSIKCVYIKFVLFIYFFMCTIICLGSKFKCLFKTLIFTVAIILKAYFYLMTQYFNAIVEDLKLKIDLYWFFFIDFYPVLIIHFLIVFWANIIT